MALTTFSDSLLCGVGLIALPTVAQRTSTRNESERTNLVRRLTAFENVLGGRLPHVAPWRGILRQFDRSDKRKTFECLERVGLLDQAHQRADTLSGEQQQRFTVARALAQVARLIVADEPIASLDPASAATVMNLLDDIVSNDGVS